MKTIFTTKEGVKMNSELDFGDTKNIANEFIYLMDTLEYMEEIQIKYFYRITDDHYIQLATKIEDGELKIVAQYKLLFKTLKENIIFIVKTNIEAHHLYEGFPTFLKSDVFSEQEFNSIVQSITDKINTISEQAEANKTPLINYFNTQQLHPKPTGNTPFSWIANCPSKGNHFIMIDSKTDTWGCGYCNKKGGISELEAWLHQLLRENDRMKLSQMMEELNESGSIKSKEIMQWWLNRY